jgi:hypothetical protein
MLAEKQKTYLLTIPKNRKAIVKPFNPKSLSVAQEIMSQIESVEPNLKVKLLG